MTSDEMRKRLYEKMQAEQDEFKAELLTKSPQEILEKAYSYYIREDILIEIENGNLSSRQMRALLKEDAPLASLYDEWLSNDYSYMDMIRDTIDEYADKQANYLDEKKREDREER